MFSTNTSFIFNFQVHDKKSYALNCVVWVRQGGLQSDIQKILRHARKLPDKTQSFYKVALSIVDRNLNVYRK